MHTLLEHVHAAAFNDTLLTNNLKSGVVSHSTRSCRTQNVRNKLDLAKKKQVKRKRESHTDRPIEKALQWFVLHLYLDAGLFFHV